MKWYEKLWEYVKVVFSFIGKCFKKFFAMFNSVEKLLSFAVSVAFVGTLVSLDAPISKIFVMVLYVALLIKLSFDISKK